MYAGRFRRRRLLLAAFLTAALVSPGALAAAGPVSAASQLGMVLDALDVAVMSPPVRLLRTLTGTSINRGNDGRVTALLLGSDFRPSLAGERTDIVIVISINPKTKEMAAVSIPRDVARLPICGGKTYKGKVNGMFATYRSSLKSRDNALNKMRTELGCTLGVEIDYHAMIRMTAFNVLTGNVGGYTVNNPAAIKDTKFWDNPNAPRGIYFPIDSSLDLKGDPPSTVLCNGWFFSGRPKALGAKCDRAIVYVRTRKGRGNSDFKRTRRAQDVVAAAVSKVIQRDKGGNLTSLWETALAQKNAGAINTNIPISSTSALDFYALLSGATLTKQAVFAPSTYASKISGTSSYQLKITAVRNLTKSWFAPVN